MYFHEIPTLTEEGLKIWKQKREEVMNSRRSGDYTNLSNKLYDVFSGKDVDRIVSEHKEFKLRSDYELVKYMMEKVIPFYLPSNQLVGYILEIAFRDMNYVNSRAGSRGRKDQPVHREVFTVEEWKNNWEKYIILDKIAYTNDLKQYVPEGMNYTTTLPMATRHMFFPVIEKKVKLKNKNNHKNHNGFQNHDIVCPEYMFSCRTKSGHSFGYKLVEYLSGMRKKITDFTGAQIAHKNSYEDKSVDIFQSFIGNNKGYCDNLLILQSLNPKTNQKKKFLSNVSKSRNLIENILSEEDRSKKIHFTQTELNELKTQNYLEILMPFSCVFDDCGNGFGQNVIEIQTYHIPTLKKIDEKYNHSLYEGRKDDKRDTWLYFDWVLLDNISDKFLQGFSKEYVRQILPRWIGSKDRLFIPK